MSPIVLFLVWLLNGLLVLAYFIADHILVALLIPVLGWLGWTTPREQRRWFIVAGGLTLLVAALAPSPIPLFILIMVALAAIAIRVERFNPNMLRWRITSGLALYALIGLGFTIYQDLISHMAIGSGGLLERGQSYLDIIVSIAVYAFPLGFLVLLAQAIWAHPPTIDSPGNLINTVRSRGKN